MATPSLFALLKNKITAYNQNTFFRNRALVQFDKNGNNKKE
ncbi:MAG: hypothetical protein ACJA01_001029 [Saprospiraceae bacterium]|jgi:hypothetical protein